MKEGNASMGIQESLDFIIENMATKSEVEEIRERMATKSEVEEILQNMATKSDLEEIQKTLDDHTVQLNSIHTDITIMRDKRLQLEVRVGHIEKHLNITSR